MRWGCAWHVRGMQGGPGDQRGQLWEQKKLGEWGRPHRVLRAMVRTLGATEGSEQRRERIRLGFAQGLSGPCLGAGSRGEGRGDRRSRKRCVCLGPWRQISR